MPEIAINDETGERLMLDERSRTWKPLPNARAPGAKYLLEDFSKNDKSEDAYYRQWRDKDNVATSAARSVIPATRRLEGLLARQKAQNQGTGGIYAVPLVGRVMGFMDPEIREMDAIQSKMARSERTPGEGAISDYDAQQFMAMSPGRDKPLKTNEALIRAQRLAADAQIQRRQFAEWHKATYGNLTGVEEAWDRYAQDNPIFAPDSESDGAPKLNPGRQNWRQYFGVTRGEGDARPTQAQTDVQRASLPPALRKAPPNNVPTAKVIYEIDRMKKAGEFDAKAKRGSSPNNPFVAVNPAVAAKLPKGSYYMDANGDLWQK